jgi:LysR family transcriptional regulator, cell division regulator
MNINDLKIFQAVAEHGSFTKAAAITNTVQSNVTARIKFLESYFNAKLLERTTRQIELTDEGLQVLKAAKELQLIIDKTKSSISKTISSPKGTIKIGCIQSTAALRAPGILGNFTTTYPEMDFRLKTGTTNDLIKDVLSFKLDGAFISGNIKNSLLDVESVFMEELSIVTSSINKSLEQTFNNGKPVKLIVFSKGCSYRDRLINILESIDLKRFKLIEVDTLDGIINSVEAGVGITLLPLELIKKHYYYRGLNTFAPAKKFSTCPTIFIKRKDFPMNEGYDLFVQSIIKGYSQNVQKTDIGILS